MTAQNFFCKMHLKNFEEAIPVFKKFFAVFFLAATLLIVGQSSDAQAYRVHVGNYQDNGEAAYLLTETLAGSRSNFSCTVVTDRGNRIYYNFYYASGGPYYSNSWGASAYVYGSGSPVAIGIWNWVQNH